MSTFYTDDILVDTQIPSAEEIIARSCAPAAHKGDVVILVKGLHVWKKRADLKPDEPFIPFFGGDFRTVLEPDDPRLKA